MWNKGGRPAAVAEVCHLTRLFTHVSSTAHPLWAKLKLLRTLTSVSGQMLLLRLFLAAADPVAGALRSCPVIKGCMRSPVTACRPCFELFRGRALTMPHLRVNPPL